jgi:hypothetical protein
LLRAFPEPAVCVSDFFVSARAEILQKLKDGLLALPDSLDARCRLMRTPDIGSSGSCMRLGIEEAIHVRAANSSSRITPYKR